MANLSNINNKFIVEDSGDVGIGVTTATTKLHIGGTAPGDSIIRQDSTVSGTNWEIGERAAGKWQIFEDDGDSIVATFMSSGNVGIGTPSPGESLEIYKDGGAIIKLHDPGNNSWKLKADTDFHIYDDSNSDYLTILNNGNVGIGTASPGSSKLTVSDGATGYTTTALMQVRKNTANGNDTTSKAGILLGNNSNAFEIAYGGTTDRLRFIDGGGVETLTIKNGGNVGIGTTSPQNDKLHVETDTSTVYDGNSNQTGGLFVNNIYHEALNTFSQIRLGVSGASGASNVRLVGIEPSQAASDFAIVLRNGSVWGEKLRIKGVTGNVGIGVTSPNARLHVDHPANPTSIRIGSNTTDDCWVMFNTDGNDWSIGTDRSDSNKFKISDYSSLGTNDRLVIDTSGNVGIGTSTPNKRLTIGGVNATEGVNLYTKIGSTLYKLWEAEQYFSDEGYQGMYYQNVKKIQFRTNGDSYLNGGNVGIGVTPTQKLDVDGQMTHDGLVMKSGDGVYIDRYLAYTINISLIAFNWVDTGIYSNSGSYQLGASGTYAVQIYSNSHSGEPYWYDAYWSGIMSWHQGTVNQNAVFEIPLTQAAHSTNNRPLELRIQNTLGSGPGTPTNNARLEVKTTAAGTNSVSLFFRFRRLI